MGNDPLENAIEKIYNEIAITGNITDNQLSLIVLYDKKMRNKNKKTDIDELFEFCNKAINFLNKNFSKE